MKYFSKNTSQEWILLPQKITWIEDICLWEMGLSVPKGFYFSSQQELSSFELDILYRTYVKSDLYIVRSAWKNEDGKVLSYAGVFISKIWNFTWKALYADIQAVRENLVEIWDENTNYIIVQEYIVWEFSGVFFSHTLWWGSYLEYVVWENEILTSWAIHPSTITFLHNGQIDLHNISFQSKIQINWKISAYNSYAKVPIIDLQKVLSLLIWYKNSSSQYIDIEWTYSKGTLYILQIRPITRLFPIKSNENNWFLSEKWRYFLNACAVILHFFKKLGFHENEIVFDYWGWLLSYALHSGYESILDTILQEKIYILIPEESQWIKKYFYSEEHMYAFVNKDLSNIFTKLICDTGYTFIIAELPRSPQLFIVSDPSSGAQILWSIKSYNTLIEEKNLQPDIVDLWKQTRYTFLFKEMIWSNPAKRYTVTKFTHRESPKKSVYPYAFIWFDIHKYYTFPHISLLLLERSSRLAHGAILAREIGVPCIYGIPWLVLWLSEWDIIEIDFEANAVFKI